MNEEGYLTAREISEMFGLSIRTTNNRLTTFRKEHPTEFKEVKTNTKHKQYIYKVESITKENVGTRHYIKHEKKVPEIEMPPIYVVDTVTGKKFNYFSLKALLTVLESATLFERFVALDSIIFVVIIVYLCL